MKYIFIVIFILFSISIHGQESAQISRKKSELSKIKDEISSLEEELKVKTAKEKESYNVLDNYNRQSYLLHQLINSLKAEELEKELEIDTTQNNIEALQKEIRSLKKNYAKYVVAIYKHSKLDEWASILDADTFEQAILRYKYLNKFSEQRVKDLKKLQSKKDDLIAAKENLEKERKDKELLTEQKSEEENSLNTKRIERKKILNAIRNDKVSLKSELEAKRNAEIRIQNLIGKLIAEAEARRKAEAERIAREKLKLRNKTKTYASKSNVEETSSVEESSYDVDLSTTGLASFSVLKGRLNWPVSSGRIVRKFGENRNEKLNTVTLNYGVDIKTNVDADVRSVADGVISAIDWLPGYGSVIIITHKGDYRTVYSHLSNIYVKEGDRVKAGSVIGKVGESLEGDILHFEIWNSRNKQNPEVWLARK